MLNRRSHTEPPLFVFLINVISVNQQGGQTAYSITNNYYGDTTNIETNYGFDTLTENGIKYLYAWPNKGVWQSPFVGYDSLRNDISFDPGIGVSARSRVSIPFNHPTDGKTYKTMWIFKSGVCSKTIPLQIGILNAKGFVLFGDYADLTKIYCYYLGKVYYTPYGD